MATSDSNTNPLFWIVLDKHHNPVGVFSELKSAKRAVREQYKDNRLSEDYKFKFDAKTYGYKIIAYPDFPSDWEREYFAYIFCVILDKSYPRNFVGESISD